MNPLQKSSRKKRREGNEQKEPELRVQAEADAPTVSVGGYLCGCVQLKS